MAKDSYCSSMDNRKFLCAEFSNWFRSRSCVMVDEEKTIEEEPTAEDSGDGDKPKSTAPIDAANEAAERLEQANKKKETLLDREEALMVQARLSGRAEAGAEPVKPKEETPKEYRARIEKEIAEGKHDD